MSTQKHKLAALIMFGLISAIAFSGCTQEDQARIKNVKPPTPGTPASGGDVTGIYRSFNLAVLQLRADGSYALIVKDSKPTAGQFTLANGQLEVQSKSCGDTIGRYTMVVTGEKKAGKARLEITPMSDDCAQRRTDLTAAPWVYADS
ncbi:MAG TPA: hypothetical protein VM121_01790 [Acidimicrobiales bacterium]|nr:hypothetical protein [Acidimicrobiales bacterium]